MHFNDEDEIYQAEFAKVDSAHSIYKAMLKALVCCATREQMEVSANDVAMAMDGVSEWLYGAVENEVQTLQNAGYDISHRPSGWSQMHLDAYRHIAAENAERAKATRDVVCDSDLFHRQLNGNPLKAMEYAAWMLKQQGRVTRAELNAAAGGGDA